jgi:hypothetical protein
MHAVAILSACPDARRSDSYNPRLELWLWCLFWKGGLPHLFNSKRWQSASAFITPERPDF